MKRRSRLVAPVAGMLLAVAAVGSGAALSAPAVAQAPSPSELCDSSAVDQFSDVADSDYAAAYILCMRALGLSQGRSDGDFGPDRKLNRGQMASFLIRLWTDHLGGQCPTDVVVPFTDTGGTTHETNIECLFGLGITQGTTATTYGPQDLLKASQISRFLYRTYQEAGGDQCAGTAASELVRASECLFNLRVVPGQAEATSATPVIRSQMGVYVIGLWHNLTGRGLPPAPPLLGAATPSTTTTTQPTVTQGPAVLDERGIWVTRADGADARHVAPDGRVPVWSPDGSRIAYEDDGVWVVRGDGADAKHIVPNGRVPVWSPDGSRIAYEDDGVWVVRGDGADAKHIVPNGRVPVWSPDGSRIAYQDDGVWVVGADGSGARQLVSGGFDPVWSPDGSHVYYWRDGLWVVRADGVNPRQISTSGHSPVWSPDGARVVYEDDGLWVVGADGSGARQLVSGGRDLTWSPDGSRIAYRDDADGLWVGDADGTDAKQIASDLVWGGAGADWDWSPDGSHIAYMIRIYSEDSSYEVSNEVWVVRADGTNPQMVATTTNDLGLLDLGLLSVAWSPDGSRIAYRVYVIERG